MAFTDTLKVVFALTQPVEVLVTVMVFVYTAAGAVESIVNVIGDTGNVAFVTFDASEAEPYTILYVLGEPVVLLYGSDTLVPPLHSVGFVPGVIEGCAFTVTVWVTLQPLDNE